MLILVNLTTKKKIKLLKRYLYILKTKIIKKLCKLRIHLTICSLLLIKSYVTTEVKILAKENNTYLTYKSNWCNFILCMMKQGWEPKLRNKLMFLNENL